MVMERYFKAHDLGFIVQSDSRPDGMGNLDTTCLRLESLFQGLPGKRVSDLHSGAMIKTALGDIGCEIDLDKMPEWHDHIGVLVSLIAVQA
jgi:hypothetical protein